MPKDRQGKTTRVGAGRKPLAWTDQRKALARRIAAVRDAIGSGYKLRQLAGRTALGWCAPANERARGAWAEVSTPDVTNLLAFAASTGRRPAWLLTGELPEMAGESVPRVDLEALVRDFCHAAMPPEDVAWMFATGSAVDGAACLAKLRELACESVRATRKQDETIRALWAVQWALSTASINEHPDFPKAERLQRANAWLDLVRNVAPFLEQSPLVSGAVISFGWGRMEFHAGMSLFSATAD